MCTYPFITLRTHRLKLRVETKKSSRCRLEVEPEIREGEEGNGKECRVVVRRCNQETAASNVVDGRRSDASVLGGYAKVGGSDLD